MPYSDSQPRDKDGKWTSGGSSGAEKWVSNYEARSINADTLTALDRLAGYPAYCHIFSILRS